MTTHQNRSYWLLFSLTLYLCSTLISMATMSIGVVTLIILAIYAGWRPTHLINTFKLNTQNQAFGALSCAFSAACILSLILSKTIPIILAGHPPTVHLLKDSLKLWYFILPFFIASLLKMMSAQERKKTLVVWLSLAGILGILGIIQFFTGFPREQIIPTQPNFFHATLFFGHHLSSSSILIFPFMVSVALASSSHLKDRKLTLISRMTSITLGITLILSWSRMLWIALPCGLFVLLIKRFNPRLRKIALASICTIFGVILVLGSINFKRIERDFFSQRGTNERTALWEANLSFIKMRPITGIGLRKSEEMSFYYFLDKDPLTARNRFVGHAHNNILEVLAGTGALGFIFWCLWNYWVFKTGYQLIRINSIPNRHLEGELALAIFCAWITFHLNGLTQVNFFEGKVMHQMMWGIALLIFLNQDSSRESSFFPKNSNT